MKLEELKNWNFDNELTVAEWKITLTDDNQFRLENDQEGITVDTAEEVMKIIEL